MITTLGNIGSKPTAQSCCCVPANGPVRWPMPRMWFRKPLCATGVTSVICPVNRRPCLSLPFGRAALDHARRHARRTLREEKADGGLEEREYTFEPLPGEDADRRREIEIALQRLPAVQREVLVLKIWNELTFEQIGATLEIPPNTEGERKKLPPEVVKQLEKLDNDTISFEAGDKFEHEVLPLPAEPAKTKIRRELGRPASPALRPL